MSTTIAVRAAGTVDLPGDAPYPIGMDIITDPARLPTNRDELSDDAVIGIKVWAALQGVEVSTVNRNRTLADARRRGEAGDAEAAEKYGPVRPGDMPAEDGKLGNSPYWTVATYRAWEAARPGQGASPGRPVGSGRGPAVKATLPITCPNCAHVITADEVPADKLSQRRSRSGRGQAA